MAERQRDQIADQQKQITDSIRYASRIQAAVLPRTNNLNNYLTEHFVYYQPKNIVSGDFFWTTQLADGRIAVPVADCTGHGVPGAFMSMLAMLIKELTATHCAESAGDLLFRLRQLVIASLNQTGVEGESQFYGMDMSLVLIDKEKQELNMLGHTYPF